MHWWLVVKPEHAGQEPRRLYVKHHATVCVSKCFPWGSRQPNWHWRLARLPEYPGDRYWAASRHISRRHLFFFFILPLLPLHFIPPSDQHGYSTDLPQLAILCTLRRIRRANQFTRHRSYLITKHVAFKKHPAVCSGTECSFQRRRQVVNFFVSVFCPRGLKCS
jgi:hypothetical protein